MANLSGNPWNFTSADAATATAITAIVRNGQGSALITATAHGLSVGQNISLQGNTPTGWNRGYQVVGVPTANTFLVPITPDQSLLGNGSAFGSVYTAAYMQLIEVTQMLWDGPTATNTMLLTDLTGRTLWNPTAVTGGSYTYMKAFPVFGLVINSLPSGTLQISV